MTGLIDRAHLAAQTFGDDDLAREVLGLFVAQCRRLLPDIAGAGLDPRDRADLAHTLKGSALGVGAVRIAELSAAAEEGFRTGTLPPDLLASLSAAVEATLVEIAAPG